MIRSNLLRWLVFVVGAPAAFSSVGQLFLENLLWMYDLAIHYLPSAPLLFDQDSKRILGYVVDGELVEL